MTSSPLQQRVKYAKSSVLVLAGIAIASAAFLTGNALGEAATTAPPRLCYNTKGTVVVRTTCKTGEREFSAMPGRVTQSELPAQTIPQGTSAARPAAPTKLAGASGISTLDVLSTSARVYTRRIRFPAGTPIGTKVTSVTDLSDPLDPWNQTAVLPNCPLDAPMTIATTYYAQIDQNPNFHITEEDLNKLWVVRVLEDAQETTMPYEFRTYQWYVGKGSQDENEMSLEILPFNWSGGAIDPSETLPWDVDFYVSRACAPIVSLEAAG